MVKRSLKSLNSVPGAGVVVVDLVGTEDSEELELSSLESEELAGGGADLETEETFFIALAGFFGASSLDDAERSELEETLLGRDIRGATVTLLVALSFFLC